MALASKQLKGDHNIDTEKLSKVMMANGIVNRSQIDWYNKFHRFGCLDPYNRVNGVREYVFFTKPDLNIMTDGSLNKGLANVALFIDAKERYPEILKQLQYSASSNFPYVNILSNARTSNVDIPGKDATYLESSANIHGTKIQYRKNSYSSDEAFDFNIEFEDTKYLEVYTFFKLYDEYCNRKDYGTIDPGYNNTINRQLHDRLTLFRFLVDEESEYIIHYSALVGCYIKTTPRDSLSDIPESGPLRFTVGFHCPFFREDPLVLAHFNQIAQEHPLGSKEIPIYDDSIGMVSGEWCNMPYVVRDVSKMNNIAQFKIKWR